MNCHLTEAIGETRWPYSLLLHQAPRTGGHAGPTKGTQPRAEGMASALVKKQLARITVPPWA
jgi:hypothetical protein